MFDHGNDEDYCIALIAHGQEMGNTIGIRLAGMNSLRSKKLCLEEGESQEFDQGDDVLRTIGEC